MNVSSNIFWASYFMMRNQLMRDPCNDNSLLSCAFTIISLPVSFSSLIRKCLAVYFFEFTFLTWTLLSFLDVYVMPDVRISEREERRLPRQCNLQKRGKFIADSSQGSRHASNTVVWGQRALNPSCCPIYKVFISSW